MNTNCLVSSLYQKGDNAVTWPQHRMQALQALQALQAWGYCHPSHSSEEAMAAADGGSALL